MKAKINFALTLIFILGASVLLTIYLAWLFYPTEIDLLNITTNMGIAKVTIQKNFNVLLQYLTNPFKTSLSMPDFPSSKDGLHHFAQVKFLFHFTQAATLLALPGFIFFIKDVILKGFGRIFRHGFLIAAATPAVIAALALLIGFNRFFTLFHQILFLGDETWLFSPYTDPVIQILPEIFFMHCFIVFFVIYEVACLTFARQSRRDKYGILRD